MAAKRVFNGFVIALAISSLVEVVAGLILLPTYKPNAQTAYASVKDIQSSPLLSALQGFHHWLSAALIVGAAAGIIFGLLGAAYSRSSKKLWLSSVLLVVVFGLLQLTGHILPWDQHAVRTAAIETGIAQSAPGIGNVQAQLLRGGSSISPNTLSVWFWAHIGILSLVWLLLSWVAVRKARINGFSIASTIVGTLVLVGVSAGCAFAMPVKFGQAATSADYSAFTARPEWYIVPLHVLLTQFQKIDPTVGWIGAMVVPGIVLVLVLIAPWADRRGISGKMPIYGPVLGVLLLGSTIALFAMGVSFVATPSGPNTFAAATTVNANQKLDPQLIAQGKQLMQTSGCLGCHSLTQEQDGVPALNGTGSRHDLQWQIQHLTNPNSTSPGSTMPAYGRLGQAKIAAIANYLASLR